MKTVLHAFLAFLFTLALSSAVAAQEPSAEISPNNISAGVNQNITVTLSGAPANACLIVTFIGVGNNGTVAAMERKVTTDAGGVASWVETVNWPADSYETVISWNEPGGQPSNTNSGSCECQ